MLRRDADHQTDPLVLLWDAVASGSASPATGDNPGAAGLISEFLALADTPMPDSGFLNRLEGEVIDAGRKNQAAKTPVWRPVRANAMISGVVAHSRNAILETRARLPRYGRWLAAQAALAMLLLIAFASVGIIYLTDQPADHSIIPAQTGSEIATPDPGTPDVETLLNAEIDPAAVGAESQSEWTTASLFMFSLEPGEGFSVDRETWGSSLNVFTMLEGELSVQSGSPSLVFRRGSNVPETVNAGERARIVVGDSWVAGFDTEVSGQNDGTKDADVLIHANTKDWGAFSPPSSFPAATPSGNHADDSDLSLQFDGPVTFDLQRVTLGQDEELNVVVSDTETLLLVTDAGNMVRITRDGASAGISTTASALHTYPEGAYTISGGYTMSPDSNGTTTVYIARMRNAAAGAQNVASTPTAESASPESTPVASAVRPESIVTLEIDPTELGIGSPDTWDRMEFALVTVKVGEGFTTDHPYFTCCDGIAIFHIQQGSASFEVDGPVDLYTAGAEQGPARIASGTLIDLEPGDSVVLAKYALAIVANTGSAELLMLAGYGDEYSLEPVWAKPIEGYNDWPWITGSNLDQIAVNVVDVSFEQVTLEPGGLTYIDSNPEEWLAGWFPERSSTTVRMMRGTHSATSENPLDSFVVQTFVMDNFSSGPYTFFNAGNSTATLYLMRIVPVESPPPASSPVAEATLSGVLQMTTGP